MKWSGLPDEESVLIYNQTNIKNIIIFTFLEDSKIIMNDVTEKM